MKILLIVLMAAFKATFVTSFYRYGHTKFGYLLQQNLKRTAPELDEKLQRYLKLEPGLTIEKASIWADQIKKRPKYCWSAPMHYININRCFTDEKDILTYCKQNVK